MVLLTFDEAAAFLATVRADLEEHEPVTDLMLGLAERLVDDPLAWGSPPYFAAVVDKRGPLLAALMTPPHNLVLHSGREGVEGLELVVRDLIDHSWPVRGVVGPGDLAQPFAELWTRLTGVAGRPGMNQRIYVLRQVIHPRYSPGSLRPAREDESDLILGWLDAFRQEAAPDGPPPAREATRRRIVERSAFFWDDHGPVSMALKSRPTRRGITISGVYTPPALRRRGYATSCVAALSAQLLAEGREYCTLFTDLSNPTSNDIYQQIGYRPVCDFREIKFV